MSIRIEPTDGFLFVDAASTGSLTLSGLQTVDGVALSAGKLCLAKNQGSVQAVYMVQSTAWIPVDPGIGFGLQVLVRGGSQAGAIFRCTTSDPVAWGTTATTFVSAAPPGGAAFDPANPGNIGTGTQGTLQATEIDAKTYASDTTLPGLLAGFMKLFGISVTGGTTDLLRILGRTGDAMSLEFPNQTGTSKSRLLMRPVSLANAGATVSVGTNGRGGVILVVGTTSTAAIGGIVLCSRNGTVNATGCATSNFAASDTGGSLCAVAGTNDVTIKNNSAGTVDLLIVGLFHDAN